MNTSPFLTPVRADLDWTSLRLPGEMELRREIVLQPDLQQQLDDCCKTSKVRQRCDGGVKVSPSLCPAGYRVASMIRQTLQLRAEIEMVIVPVDDWRVDVSPSSNDDLIRVVVAANVLKSLWFREALFHVGRRIGRLLFSQIPLLVDPSTGSDRRDRSTLLGRGIWKFQELSCDRIGMLCCQDDDTAVRAILKASSGLGDDLLKPHLESLLTLRVEEEEAMTADDAHEFAMLRIAAVQKFAESEKYRSTLWKNEDEAGVENGDVIAFPRLAIPSGAAAGPIWKEPAPQVAEPAAVVASDPAVEESTRRKFMLSAAFWIASCDEIIRGDRRDSLTAMFGPEVFAEAPSLLEGGDGAAFEKQCQEIASVARKLPESERRQCLTELMPIAAADGVIGARENDILHSLADMLGVEEDSVRSLMEPYSEPRFAAYDFKTGEAVEVKWDGEWVPGVVERREGAGDLRVRFGFNEVLRLNPTADLIRPRDQSAA